MTLRRIPFYRSMKTEPAFMSIFSEYSRTFRARNVHSNTRRIIMSAMLFYREDPQ